MEANVSVDVGSNIAGLLEKLAIQLGTTVDKIYPLYVKQQVLEGYSFFIIMAIAISLIVLFMYIFRKWENSNGDKLPLYVGGVFLFVSCIFLAGEFTKNFTKIYNPEYHAVQKIVRDVSSLSK